MLVAPYASHWRSITLQRRHQAHLATRLPDPFGLFDFSGVVRPPTVQMHSGVSCLLRSILHVRFGGGKLALGFLLLLLQLAVLTRLRKAGWPIAAGTHAL